MVELDGAETLGGDPLVDEDTQKRTVAGAGLEDETAGELAAKLLLNLSKMLCVRLARAGTDEGNKTFVLHVLGFRG